MATQSDRLTGSPYEVPAPAERSSDPDRVRREIEETRVELAHDVNRLADRTSPTRVARRNWDRLGSRVSSIKETVMGAPRSGGHAAAGKARYAGQKVQDATQSAAETVREAPGMVARQTRGNPLAVGLIAFGAGLLAATLLPETDSERRAGQQLAEHADALVEPIRESAGQIKDEVADSARQSATEVQEAARDAAQSTAQSAKESAQEVKRTTTG
jgi:hypothetical protein